ncbi:MAG: ATP synthase F1 subunit gamma [Bacteroidales bacterium]|nr:ATP synthase F1 subunit gamma [Bacteroidales bacterium]
MPTLKEIKGRIASVKNTLKITSAMKLVSSAKLRKAQTAIENMRPYERQLQRILASAGGDSCTKTADWVPDVPRAVIAIASNSSLCGGFNANVIAKVRSVRREGDAVYSIGRKMADAMRRDGFPSPEDYTALSEHPSFAPVASLAEKLAVQLEEGRIAQVLMVYNHFVSTAKQQPVVEVLMGADPSAQVPQDDTSAAPQDDAVILSDSEESSDVIIEPSRQELLKVLLPKTVKLKLYAALLDSAAAEHAARTVAMQTATDNAENLLAELTLQYNKGRQQKITSEILDLAGGQAENQQ